jgi:outer membrane protein
MGRLTGRLLVVCAVASSLAAAAAAQEPSNPDRGKPPQASPAGPRSPTLQGKLGLSIREAVTMGIENNLDVEIVRHDPPIASHEHRAAWGAYDPALFSEFGYASTETPIASALQARNILFEREVSGQAGLRGLAPKLGWEYQLAYAGQSLESDSSIQSLSPEYRTSVLGILTIPLLKGAWWGEPWVQVKLTGIASQAAVDEFRRALMDTVRDIESAYWNLAARAEDLEVARKSRETARALLDQTQTQYEVGVVSRVEVVEAEAGLADREFRVIQAENQYRAAQDSLIDLVLGPFLEPTTQLEVVPTDSPEQYATFEVDADLSARLAYEHRPELALARRAEEQQAIALKFAKNQRLPQLDLRGTYGFQGLAGKENPDRAVFGAPVAPLMIERRYSAAHDDFFSSDGARQWSGRALLSIPLGNVSGRANVSRAELELRRARVQMRRIEQSIVLEVREAIRNLGSGRQGIGAAERRRVAAAEQLRAERVRLEYGESTPFNVLLREEDLVDADRQKIFALQVYQDSITALDRAQGTLLRDRNIVVEEALVLR